MTSLRKYWWTALTLAAIVGCNGEETAPSGATPSTANPGPAPSAGPGAPSTPAPSTTPAAKPEAEKPADKAATKSDALPPPVEAPKTDEGKKDAPKAKDDDKKAAAVKLNDDEIANIKKLPAAEQPIALKQLVCPVSDEHLGEMGTPVKVSAEGKTFFLCCKSCEKDVKSNPKAVVAKLKD